MKAGEESIVTQVERFEEYCLRERSLEGDIELALARRVDAAVEAVELAEHELENATRERAEIEARVERARQLEFDRAKEFRSPVDSRLQAFSNGTTESKVLQATMDPDDFSDVPDPHQGAAGTGVGQEAKLNASSHPKDDLSDEFITLLVQRYTDICHERQMLQEEIEDFLVRKERTAAEKLRHARIACEATRQKAVEIVAALNEASQGDSRVNLPTRCISPVGSLSDFPDANGVHPSASGPIAIPPLPLVTGPDPVQAGERSTPIDAPNQAPSQASYAPTGNHSLDGSRSPVPIHLATGSSNNPPATVPSFSSPTITPTQQEIYKKYDLMMIAAKASGQGVSMLKIPWPILMPHAHHYPMQNVMVNHLEDLIVINFFQGYFQWKGWNYVVEGVSILTDWGHIFSQIPDHKRGGRQCAEKVFLILRDLLQI